MARILVVEDEQAIGELICRNLRLVGHQTEVSFDGEDALRQLATGGFDLALLDVMIPGMSGFEIKQRLKAETPVIFVTAKGSLSSRLEGLGLGADDYITKPFEILELLARVEAVLRRTNKQERVFEHAGTRVELDTRLVFVEGTEVVLTPKEFELLEALIINRNLALSRERLLELVWGYDYVGKSRTVDMHILRLRKKLNWEDTLQTVYKMGYRLNTRLGS
jgi:DNA-binding response OmpR family regulator